MAGQKYHCSKCNKTMDENNFYTYKGGAKTEMCKKCLTMHIDNFNPDTFLWLLEKMDVPYVMTEWNIIRDREFAKNPDKMNGMSVFGKYLSRMKLKQFKDTCWADSERLNKEAQESADAVSAAQAAIDEDIQKRYEAGEISEAQYKTMMSVQRQHREYMSAPSTPYLGPNNPFDENQFLIDEEDLPDFSKKLTQEDKLYLAMKWGRTYRPSDWIELERNYNEMTASFDIQDADTDNTLIVLCKTNLKMNQAIDEGDIEGFQKLSKVYESLRKSAKFTAAQNKEEKNDYVDSVGELVVMCEKEGFIPRYATDVPKDIVDLVLHDMKGYTTRLIKEELGFGQQIENAIKKIQIQREMNEQEDAKMKDIENADFIDEVSDEDYADYLDSIKEQKEEDANKVYYKELK